MISHLFVKYPIILVLLTGCGTNTLGPSGITIYDTGPYLVFGSFDKFISRFDSPEMLSIWLEKNAEYNEAVASNTLDGPGILEDYARFLYKTKKGACLHYSSTYALVNEKNGYRSGVLFSFHGISGHAISWFIGKSGAVSIVDGTKIHRDIHKSLEDLHYHYQNQGIVHEIYNSRFDRIY